MSRASGISSGQRFMCNDMYERISKMATLQKHYHKPIQRNETFQTAVLSSTKALETKGERESGFHDYRDSIGLFNIISFKDFMK